MYFLEKVKTALQNLENPKVLLKDPVGPNEGPWLVMLGAALVSLESLDMTLMFRMQKYGQYSRFSPAGHLKRPPG